MDLNGRLSESMLVGWHMPVKKTRSEVGEHPSFGESSYAIDPLLVVP